MIRTRRQWGEIINPTCVNWSVTPKLLPISLHQEKGASSTAPDGATLIFVHNKATPEEMTRDYASMMRRCVSAFFADSKLNIGDGAREESGGKGERAEAAARRSDGGKGGGGEGQRCGKARGSQGGDDGKAGDEGKADRSANINLFLLPEMGMEPRGEQRLVEDAWRRPDLPPIKKEDFK